MNSPIKNEYSIREKFQLGWWLLKTKLLNPKARLIRFPFTIRGGGGHRLRQRPSPRGRLSVGGLPDERLPPQKHYFRPQYAA